MPRHRGSLSDSLSMRFLFADHPLLLPSYPAYAYPFPFLILIDLDSRSVCMYNLSPSLHRLRCRTLPFIFSSSPPHSHLSFIPSSPPFSLPLHHSPSDRRPWPLLSLFSVLGFVWVESVSRGHCILYIHTSTYDLHVYLAIFFLPHPFTLPMYYPSPPRSSRACVY